MEKIYEALIGKRFYVNMITGKDRFESVLKSMECYEPTYLKMLGERYKIWLGLYDYILYHQDMLECYDLPIGQSLVEHCIDALNNIKYGPDEIEDLRENLKHAKKLIDHLDMLSYVDIREQLSKYREHEIEKYYNVQKIAAQNDSLMQGAAYSLDSFKKIKMLLYVTDSMISAQKLKQYGFKPSIEIASDNEMERNGRNIIGVFLPAYQYLIKRERIRNMAEEYKVPIGVAMVADCEHRLKNIEKEGKELRDDESRRYLFEQLKRNLITAEKYQKDFDCLHPELLKRNSERIKNESTLER